MMKRTILSVMVCMTLCSCSIYDDIICSLLQGQVNIDYMSNRIKEHPNEYTYYFDRGVGYSLMDKYDLAIDDYTKTITLLPRYYKAYYNRGIMYSMLNQIDLAIADFKKVIEFRPDFFLAYNELGRVYLENGKYEESRDILEKALKDPQKSVREETLLFLSACYSKLNQNHKTNSMLRELVTDYPDFYMGLNNYVSFLLECDDKKFQNHELALQIAKKSAQKFNNASSYYMLSQAYYMNHDLSNAITSAKNALDLYNDSDIGTTIFDGGNQNLYQAIIDDIAKYKSEEKLQKCE